MNTALEADIVVIGGGVIGLCVAEKLASRGRSVTLIERQHIAAGASAGNAAGFALSEVLPMASPASIRKALRWLTDPVGPFAVVPADLPQTGPWLLRFALASRRSTYRQSLQTLAALMRLERQTLPTLLQRTGLASQVTQTGALYLYDSQAQLERDLPDWQRRAGQGVEYERLSAAQLHQRQPGLASSLDAAIHVPDYYQVSDPADYCQALHQAINAAGVVCRYQHVEAIQITSNRPVLHCTGGQLIAANKVVVAAGPWSAQLCRQLGDDVALVGERGYNTTLSKSAFAALTQPLFFTAHGFVLAPLENGVRVGGASEIASLERAANFERARRMLATAKQWVPDLNIDGGVEWMGRRPTTPDTLPVIGQSSQSADVVYAFGHGHLGLTLASSTAQLVADLILERPASVDIAGLGADRF